MSSLKPDRPTRNEIVPQWAKKERVLALVDRPLDPIERGFDVATLENIDQKRTRVDTPESVRIQTQVSLQFEFKS